MIASLDRHLKNKGYGLFIVRDCSSKQVLDGKAKELRLVGRRKRREALKKAQQRSEEEEEILWKSEKLGGKNP